jgi:glycerol-3-phosphate acyltransferase PlsX
MRIALDAMGGDLAPQATVEGAYLYQKETRSQHQLFLIGHKNVLRTEIEKHSDPSSYNIELIHAEENIGMEESPTEALKQKKDSSMQVGLRLHKEGAVDAFVSAGNTGAQMAASLFNLGRISGALRPAIGSFLPSERGMVFLIDVGANADCKPINLLQFGLMGSIYVDHIYRTPDLTVGLLNIGEEEKKGNECSQAAFKLMQNRLRGFKGNVEGRDILKGVVDIVVCDGFVGNIILKFAESVIGVLAKSFRHNLGTNLFINLGALLVKPAFSELRRNYDYQEYGGIPLLGVNGISIICHGSSTPKAIKNAISVAQRMSENKVNEHIARTLKDGGGTIGE